MLWVGVQVSKETLEKVVKDPSVVQTMLNRAAGDPHACHLDKAWAGVHWLLAGQLGTDENVETRVIYGGTEVGEDLGYGPARFLDPEEVKEAAARLARLSRDSLTRWYAPEQMDEAGVYPSGWAKERDESKKWLLDSVNQLARFLSDAAARGNGVITFLY